jgi:hypothetical protein
MPPTIIRAKTCTSCAAMQRDNGSQMRCHFNPPIVVPIIEWNPKGPKVVAEWSGFPVVQSDMVCRQHSPAILDARVSDLQIEGLRAS